MNRLVFVAMLLLLSSSAFCNFRFLGQKECKKNWVQNGDFDHPKVLSWGVFDVVNNWKSTGRFEIGFGNYYNPAWGTKKVAELDVLENVTMTNNPNVPKAGKYIISGSYAPRPNQKTSGIIVKFNGQIIVNDSQPKEGITDFKKEVNANKGNNVIEVIGTGRSDAYGVTFTDIALCETDDEEPTLQSNGSSGDCGDNLIKNGDFQSPNQPAWGYHNNVPHWNSNSNGRFKFELGNGKLYNAAWPNEVRIAELDVEQNVIMSQSFQSPKEGKGLLYLEYAPRTFQVNRANKSGIFVKLNGIVIHNDDNPADKVNLLPKDVVLRKGNNILEVGGTGSSDAFGVSFSNVSVKSCEKDLQNNQVKPATIPANEVKPDTKKEFLTEPLEKYKAQVDVNESNSLFKVDVTPRTEESDKNYIDLELTLRIELDQDGNAKTTVKNQKVIGGN